MSKDKIFQVFYSEQISILEISWWCFIELSFGEWSPRDYRGFSQRRLWGHHSWKVIANTILRAGFYRPSLFFDVYKEITKCHQCHIFYGKRNLVPLPLNPISIEANFQQWGLEFIGEINPNSLGQHICILTAIDYFTKWIEAIPTKRATNAVIMGFMEENILARFGCPRRIVTENAIAFKSKKNINFCH